MKTFGEVVNEVLRYGFNDGPQVNKARIEDWINEAQLQVARHADTPELQENSTLALVTGEGKYALPTDFLRLSSLAYPALLSRLWPVTLQEFDAYGEEEGVPSRYTIFKNELWLWPTPAEADTLELRYVRRPARMTAEADVPTLHEDYLHLLVDYATARAYKAEDDPEAGKEFEERYAAGLAGYRADMQMRVNDRPKQLSGTWGA